VLHRSLDLDAVEEPRGALLIAMTAREAEKRNGDGGGHERPEGQEERTVSRRGRLIIVAAIVAAGVIDGVARAVCCSPPLTAPSSLPSPSMSMPQQC
jgi:hypothetical protein